MTQNVPLIEITTERQLVTTILVHGNDVTLINEQLTSQIQSAKKLFDGLSICLSFSDAIKATEIIEIIETLRSLCVEPYCIAGVTKELAQQVNIPLVQQGNTKTNVTQKELVINNSIRSGQSISEPHRSVIIFGNVNPGAEIIAQNIYVFGAAHGRLICTDNKGKITWIAGRPELISFQSQHITAEDFGDTELSNCLVYNSSDGIHIEHL